MYNVRFSRCKPHVGLFFSVCVELQFILEQNKFKKKKKWKNLTKAGLIIFRISALELSRSRGRGFGEGVFA